MNIDRKIKVKVDGKEEELLYRMTLCGGVKKCPESGCSYVCAVKDHPKCPKHGNALKLSAENSGQCPVTFGIPQSYTGKQLQEVDSWSCQSSEGAGM